MSTGPAITRHLRLSGREPSSTILVRIAPPAFSPEDIAGLTEQEVRRGLGSIVMRCSSPLDGRGGAARIMLLFPGF